MIPTSKPAFLQTGPTQVFYGMQIRGGGGHLTNPFAFFAGNDWTDAQAQIDIGHFDAGLPTRFMQPVVGYALE